MTFGLFVFDLGLFAPSLGISIHKVGDDLKKKKEFSLLRCKDYDDDVKMAYSVLGTVCS